MIGKRIFVTGRVQGVFFRNWTVATANQLGVDGWVRNRSDGSVEIHACGAAAALDRLIAACRAGPPAAAVERVEVIDSNEPCAPGFTKKPSA
jgi:acylphosphatase